MTNKQNLLIELGTEELPPKNLKTLMNAFAGNFEKALKEAKFGFGAVSPSATPRRLTLIVSDLEDEQPSQDIERKGPALKAALDTEGQPTKAALGFMRSCGVEDISQLDQVETDKGTWLVYRHKQEGASLSSLIETLINQALKDLPIERRMRWGSTRYEFVRPVHWLVVLFGEEVLPCNVLGVSSSNKTRGHRFMSEGECQITSSDSYFETLRMQSVIVDFEERRGIISGQLDEIATQQSARVEIDEALLDEVTALVEWPVALVGGFPEEFLQVPEEALISAMKEHQRYFHLVDEDGSMLPKFITISNIQSKNPSQVISGNEKVILPRLTDARFFVDQDQKSSLEDKRAQLASVVFQSELGTYLDKTDRIEALSKFLATHLNADPKAATRGARLCKSDLVSDMVNEFPDLQGIMGGYYAAYEEESPLVQSIISEHYQPTSSGGELPSSIEGKCVAIADKLDTLVGMFGIGQPPSGSRDPFALRRQTLGIVRMCIEGELDIELVELLSEAIKVHNKDFDLEPVQAYIVDRLKNWYQEEGISFDTVDAVVSTPTWKGHLASSHRTILALESFRHSEEANALVAANKRVANILKKQTSEPNDEVQDSLFTEKAEGALYLAIQEVQAKLPSLELDSEKLKQLGSLRDQVDVYFDEVMVMVDDEALKKNRIATLYALRNLFLQVADISLLQQ
jgi:glycyl-tRNA synthetase beta chain